MTFLSEMAPDQELHLSLGCGGFSDGMWHVCLADVTDRAGTWIVQYLVWDRRGDYYEDECWFRPFDTRSAAIGWLNQQRSVPPVQTLAGLMQANCIPHHRECAGPYDKAA